MDIENNSEKIQCGFDLGDGRKCPVMLRNRPGDIRAHMRKAHGIDPDAKETTPAKEPELDTSPLPENATELQKANLRARLTQKQQLDALRKLAPNARLGVSGEKSELEQRTVMAKKLGLVTDDDHPFWADKRELNMAIIEGREIVMQHGAPYEFDQLILTKRPKVIADQLEAEQQKLAKQRKTSVVGVGEVKVTTPKTAKAE